MPDYNNTFSQLDKESQELWTLSQQTDLTTHQHRKVKSLLKNIKIHLNTLITQIQVQEEPWSLALFAPVLYRLTQAFCHPYISHTPDYLAQLIVCSLYCEQGFRVPQIIAMLTTRYRKNLEKTNQILNLVVDTINAHHQLDGPPQLHQQLRQGGVYRFFSVLQAIRQLTPKELSLRDTLADSSTSLDTLSAIIDARDTDQWNRLTLQPWLDNNANDVFFSWLRVRLNRGFPEEMLYTLLKAKGCFNDAALIEQLPLLKIVAAHYLRVIRKLFYTLRKSKNINHQQLISGAFNESMAASWMSEALFDVFIDEGRMGQVINSPINDNDDTWLHWAVGANDARRVKWLLNARGRLSQKNHDEHPAYNPEYKNTYAPDVVAVCETQTMQHIYCQAIRTQHIPKLFHLLSRVTSLPTLAGGKTLLHYACEYRHHRSLQCLLGEIRKQWAPEVYQQWLNTKDDNGQRAIDIAIAQGDLHCIKALVVAGAERPVPNDPSVNQAPVNDEQGAVLPQLLEQHPVDVEDCEIPPGPQDFPYDALVFKGGGYKGIAYGGALIEGEAQGLFKLDALTSVSGTSIGALVALLIGVGYSAQEIDDKLKDLDIAKLILSDTRSTQLLKKAKDYPILTSLLTLTNPVGWFVTGPVLTGALIRELYKLNSQEKGFGLSPGKKLHEHLCNLVQERLNKTINEGLSKDDPAWLTAKMTSFADLEAFNQRFRDNSENRGKPLPFKTMTFISMDLSTKDKITCNYENHPNASIVDGALGSATLPFLLQTQHLHDISSNPIIAERERTPIIHKDGHPYDQTDGGLVENFSHRPVDHGDVPNDKSLGMYLVNQHEMKDYTHGHSIQRVTGLLSNVCGLLLDLNMGEEKKYAEANQHRVMLINCLDVSTADMNLSPAKKAALTEQGRQAAKAFNHSRKNQPFVYHNAETLQILSSLQSGFDQGGQFHLRINLDGNLSAQQLFQLFLYGDPVMLARFENQINEPDLSDNGNTPLHYAMAHYHAYEGDEDEAPRMARCVRRLLQAGANEEALNGQEQKPNEARLCQAGGEGLQDCRIVIVPPEAEPVVEEPRVLDVNPAIVPRKPVQLPGAFALNALQLRYQHRHYNAVLSFIATRTEVAAITEDTVLPLVMEPQQNTRENAAAYQQMAQAFWRYIALSKDGVYQLTPLDDFYRQIANDKDLTAAYRQDADAVFTEAMRANIEQWFHQAYIETIIKLVEKLKNSTQWRQAVQVPGHAPEDTVWRYDRVNVKEGDLQIALTSLVETLKIFHDERGQLPIGSQAYHQVIAGLFAPNDPLRTYFEQVIQPFLGDQFADLLEQWSYVDGQPQIKPVDEFCQWMYQTAALHTDALQSPEAAHYEALLALMTQLLSVCQEPHWIKTYAGYPTMTQAKQLMQTVSAALPQNYWVGTLVPTTLERFAAVALSINQGVTQLDELPHIKENRQRVVLPGLRYCPATGVSLADNTLLLTLLCIGQLPLNYRDAHNHTVTDYCVSHGQPMLLKTLYRARGGLSQQSQSQTLVNESVALISCPQSQQQLSHHVLSLTLDAKKQDILIDLAKLLKDHRGKLLEREISHFWTLGVKKRRFNYNSHSRMERRLEQRKPLEALLTDSPALLITHLGKNGYVVVVNHDCRYDERYFMPHNFTTIRNALQRAYTIAYEGNHKSKFARNVAVLIKKVDAILREREKDNANQRNVRYLSVPPPGTIEQALIPAPDQNVEVALHDLRRQLAQQLAGIERRAEQRAQPLEAENVRLRKDKQVLADQYTQKCMEAEEKDAALEEKDAALEQERKEKQLALARLAELERRILEGSDANHELANVEQPDDDSSEEDMPEIPAIPGRRR